MGLLVSPTLVGSLVIGISVGLPLGCDPIRRLRTLADSPRVKEVLDIGSIPGLSQIINDDGNTGDDESNFTDTMKVAYSTIQVAIFRNYIDEYVTSTDSLSPDVTPVEATGVFKRLVEDNEYSLTKPPDILVKKLHYECSLCTRGGGTT